MSLVSRYSESYCGLLINAFKHIAQLREGGFRQQRTNIGASALTRPWSLPGRHWRASVTKWRRSLGQRTGRPMQHCVLLKHTPAGTGSGRLPGHIEGGTHTPLRRRPFKRTMQRSADAWLKITDPMTKNNRARVAEILIVDFETTCMVSKRELQPLYSWFGLKASEYRSWDSGALLKVLIYTICNRQC